jgi:hypothetical protein
MKYDVTTLPAGIEEKDLVISTWDTTDHRWVDLACKVDTVNHVITAKISHFSAYAVMASTRPATFEVGQLAITPAQIDAGQVVNVSVLVSNTGDLAGSTNVTLLIDNVLTKTESLTLAGSANATVRFTAAPPAGVHTVSVNGLSGVLLVKELPVPTVPAPSTIAPPVIIPATFSLANLVISPGQISSGDGVNVSVVVTNTGGSAGTYDAVLKLNGDEQARKSVTLQAGQSETVAFILVLYESGTYAVDVSGEQGSLTVGQALLPPPAAPESATAQSTQFKAGWVAGGSGAFVIVVALMVVFFRHRRD